MTPDGNADGTAAADDEPQEWLEVRVPKRLFDTFRERLYDNAVAAGDAWVEDVYDLPASDFEAAITAMLTQWLLPENERRDFLTGYRKALDAAAEIRKVPIQP